MAKKPFPTTFFANAKKLDQKISYCTKSSISVLLYCTGVKKGTK